MTLIVRRSLAVLMSIMLVFPSPVWAWGADGHEIVGTMAERLLQHTRAAQRVKEILAGRSIGQVAGWADCLKNINPEQQFEYTNVGRYLDCKTFENPEDIAVITDFVKNNHDGCFSTAKTRESCHKHYHFTDLSLSQKGYSQGEFGSAGEDIVQALTASIAYLRGEAVHAPFHFSSEREALYMLIHLVGDLHQPLHVASVYLDADGRVVDPLSAAAEPGIAMRAISGTQGGNALQFEQTNLHSLWDKVSPQVRDQLLTQSQPQTQTDLPYMTPEQMRLAPQLWANDSLIDARKAFEGLNFGKKTNTPRGDRWNVELPLKYRERVEQMQVVEINKAAYRLALLLNSIYS